MEFSVKSNEDPVCPICGSRLEKKDWVRRIRRKIGGEAEWLLIERRKCTNESCRKTYRLLPAGMTEVKPERSRFLDAMEKKYREDHQMMADALPFGDYGKTGE